MPIHVNTDDMFFVILTEEHCCIVLEPAKKGTTTKKAVIVAKHLDIVVMVRLNFKIHLTVCLGISFNFLVFTDKLLRRSRSRFFTPHESWIKRPS